MEKVPAILSADMTPSSFFAVERKYARASPRESLTAELNLTMLIVLILQLEMIYPKELGSLMWEKSTL